MKLRHRILLAGVVFYLCVATFLPEWLRPEIRVDAEGGETA